MQTIGEVLPTRSNRSPSFVCQNAYFPQIMFVFIGVQGQWVNFVPDSISRPLFQKFLREEGLHTLCSLLAATLPNQCVLASSSPEASMHNFFVVRVFIYLSKKQNYVLYILK